MVTKHGVPARVWTDWDRDDFIAAFDGIVDAHNTIKAAAARHDGERLGSDREHHQRGCEGADPVWLSNTARPVLNGEARRITESGAGQQWCQINNLLPSARHDTDRLAMLDQVDASASDARPGRGSRGALRVATRRSFRHKRLTNLV